MIPVAANHAPDVVYRKRLPGFVANVLPAGNLFQHQQSDLVATIEEVPRLRIVRGAHDIAVQFVTEDVGILTLHTPRHRLANEWKRLMAVQTMQLDHLSVQGKAVIGE